MGETQLFVMRGGYNNMWKIAKHTELFFQLHIYSIQSAKQKKLTYYAGGLISIVYPVRGS